MAYLSRDYKPQKRSREILARAWAHIQSVPYKVTARWLFYRLLQDGYYSAKQDYGQRFLPLLSRARHNYYNRWRPYTLTDAGREPVVRGDGYLTPGGWIAAVKEGLSCNLARWQTQDYYVAIAFEAEAMRAQFEHYTDQITLWPFGGMPSIPYKWELAQSLYRASLRFDKPVVLLYFGDYDPMGMVIPETSLRDVQGWCEIDFKVVRAGLNAGDAARYSIPENFEHSGAYQWEALDDDAARELITGAVEEYVDLDRMQEVEGLEEEVTLAFQDYMEMFPVAKWEEREDGYK